MKTKKNLLIMIRTILMTIMCFVIAAQASAETDDIKTAATIQNAEGVTDATWTTELLKYQAKVISERAKEEARQTFVSHGGNGAIWNPKLSYQSNFFILHGMKFGIIKSHMIFVSKTSQNDSAIAVNTIKILAIKGGDMVSVTCTSDSDRQISLIDGPCNDAIKRQFGIGFAM